MIAFEVNDMTCGHCVSTITKAVKGADKDAKVVINLSLHLVQIHPSEADVQELGDAIKEAGYTPVPVQAAAAPGDSPGQSGCCGSCH
jgi:copper chaperone